MYVTYASDLSLPGPKDSSMVTPSLIKLSTKRTENMTSGVSWHTITKIKKDNGPTADITNWEHSI